VRKLEFADTSFGSPRERTRFMPKQLTLDDGLGNGTAIDSHEALTSARTMVV
jgi:hypothetical protein